MFMSLKLNVPTLADSKEAQKLSEAIATVDPTAKVEVDIEAKTVTVDASDPSQPVASEESIKQAITATGHSIQE
jgi:copper chaperone